MILISILKQKPSYYTVVKRGFDLFSVNLLSNMESYSLFSFGLIIGKASVVCSFFLLPKTRIFETTKKYLTYFIL